MTNQLMTVERAMQIHPALRNSVPHPRLSEQYKVIHTAEILASLGELGFGVRKVHVQKKWATTGQPYARHIVALAREEDSVTRADNVIPELIMVNSHDGSSACRLMEGFFRFACANGLVVVEQTSKAISYRHQGENVARLVRDTAEAAGQRLRELGYRIDRFSQVRLTEGQQRQFAQRLAALRFGERHVNPEALLVPQREADEKDDAWTVFNRVQERIIHGGFDVTTQMRSGAMQDRVSRPIKNYAAEIDLNRQMWSVLEEVAG